MFTNTYHVVTMIYASYEWMFSVPLEKRGVDK
jgi:hypothetical protein